MSQIPRGEACRAAVLGSPIAHSLSPALHRAAYASLGLDWTYTAIDMDEARLPSFLSGLDASWAGLSLTMPLKECVIGLLDSVDEEARELLSVNTVLPRNGGWHGANTDVSGIVESVMRAGLVHPPATATLLGAGATARSAVAALRHLGAAHVTVCARRSEAAESLAQLARRLGLECDARPLDPAPDLVAADIVVSTLPGEAGRTWAAIAAGAEGILLDASYHPWPTPLADAWHGRAVASGRDMLLWQAVEQVRLMTGEQPDPLVMRAALPA